MRRYCGTFPIVIRSGSETMNHIRDYFFTLR
jgi:hypothetical protein